jgi:hypothetical protein
MKVEKGWDGSLGAKRVEWEAFVLNEREWVRYTLYRNKQLKKDNFYRAQIHKQEREEINCTDSKENIKTKCNCEQIYIAPSINLSQVIIY